MAGGPLTDGSGVPGPIVFGREIAQEVVEDTVDMLPGVRHRSHKYGARGIGNSQTGTPAIPASSPNKPNLGGSVISDFAIPNGRRVERDNHPKGRRIARTSSVGLGVPLNPKPGKLALKSNENVIPYGLFTQAEIPSDIGG